MATDLFENLHARCQELIRRYLEPAIASELAATKAAQPVPEPNFDDFAAFRLLSHAELEGYFEEKANEALDSLDEAFGEGRVFIARFAALIYLYLWQERKQIDWPGERNANLYVPRQHGDAYLKELAQNALGYGRRFVKNNNGIKEASMHVLSALMGHFPDELDSVLINELNQYGRKRGDVAHRSWTLNRRTFESAEIEKNRLLEILRLTRSFYES